jgi:hypothetical protein
MEKRYYVIDTYIIEVIARRFFSYENDSCKIYADWGFVEKFKTIENIIELYNKIKEINAFSLHDLIRKIISSWETWFSKDLIFESKEEAELFIKNKTIQEIIE